jgi:peptide methionine sulfoxide reductase MsrA
MGKKQEHSLSNRKKTHNEIMDTSYDTEEITVQSLIKNGFTCEQATSWLRKIHIDKLFNKEG